MTGRALNGQEPSLYRIGHHFLRLPRREGVAKGTGPYPLLPSP